LRLFRNRFVLIALSSALRTLGYHDIRPDMIVTTDPGGYAGFHLDLSGFMDIPVAMPLTGCRGVWKWNSPVLVINQGSLTERTFVESLSIPAIDIPQNGTVAGTALILSRRLTSGPIVLAGLDMAELDTQTHSRPHAFDLFSIDLTNRINPAHSSSFINSRKRTTEVPGGHGWRTSLPLSTYASWFGSVGRGSVDRNGVFRLNPSPIAMEGLPTVTGSGLAELFPESAVSFPVSFEGNPSLSEIGDRQAIVLDLLDRLISILRSVLDGEEPGPAFFNQGNSNYFELVWTLETRNVLEYKKFLRKGTCGESRSVWERTIRSCIDFFSTNRERLAHVKH